MTYQPLTNEILEELRRIVGRQYVEYGDTEKLEPFSHDETPDRRYAHMPEAVVRPGSAEEIAAIMRLANERRFPVTPRGAGTGLSGGAVPLHGGVVLLLDRLNKMIEIDPANLMITAEPGIITNEINEQLKPYGLFFPGYPMSLEMCTLGGNVAENAGGGKAVKYGVTGRYILGLEVVTPKGEIIQLGGKRVKDVTGYDLIQLMVGSEGTLGIFTKITVKLLPTPKASADLLCLFDRVEQAIEAVPRMMLFGTMPCAIEFIDRQCFRTSCEYLNETLPCGDAEAMLLISVDGKTREDVVRDYEAIGAEVERAGAKEIYVGDNRTTSERIWRIRRNIAEAFNLVSHDQSNDDIVVPMAEIPRLLEGLRKLSEKYGISMPCYGHAGDGNVHVRMVKNPEWSTERWDETLPQILKELYALTASLGGTISGEHGIGHKRKKYMPLVCSAAHLEMIRAIKRALDPNNVLNPGKIVDL